MKIVNWFSKDLRRILFIYLILSIAASTQSVLLGPKKLGDEGKQNTHYNNYIIFKQSHHHLVQNLDLYTLYPEEQWDLYKYSPAFAVFFGILAYLPDFIGVNLWNILNALFLFFSIKYLPNITNRQKVLILLFVLIEMITSIQNEQSNALMAGLIILSFGLLEKDKLLWASLCIVASFYIKIFGAIAFVFFLFHLKKPRFMLYSIGWTILFLIVPLLVVKYDQLKFLYQSWIDMLATDHSSSEGLSVMGWLKSWFAIEPDKNLITLGGLLLFCVPLVRVKMYSEFKFRLLILASLLLWVVIFNHKAESPTFVIAITGVAIWYYPQNRKMENLILLILAFVFASLSPTDIFPRFIRESFVKPYVLKAVPCIFIWLKILYDSFLITPEQSAFVLR